MFDCVRKAFCSDKDHELINMLNHWPGIVVDDARRQEVYMVKGPGYNGLLFPTHNHPLPPPPCHHDFRPLPEVTIGAVTPLPNGRLLEPPSPMPLTLGLSPLVNTGQSFKTLPLPEPETALPEINPILVYHPQTTQSQLTWDLRHHPNYAGLCGWHQCNTEHEPEVFSEPVLRTPEPVLRIIVKVRYAANGAWVKDVEIAPRATTGSCTIGDVIWGIHISARAPLAKETVSELRENSPKRYAQACDQVRKRTQDPRANRLDCLIAVDLLGEHRHFKGLQLDRWSRSKRVWVLTLHVGTP